MHEAATCLTYRKLHWIANVSEQKASPCIHVPMKDISGMKMYAN